MFVLTAIIYPIVGAWTWGTGWLSAMGFKDFAGTTIVHSTGGLVVFAVPLLDRMRIDDVVGAVSAHLVAGIWGTLAVGIFRSGDFLVQLIGIVAVGAFVFITSSIVWLAIKFSIGIRIAEVEEMAGLDQVALGLEAYPEFGKGSQTV